MPEDKHAIFDVAWVTKRTVMTPEGPQRVPLDRPHARWYCECGTSGRKIHGKDEADAKRAAKEDHKRHAADEKE